MSRKPSLDQTVFMVQWYDESGKSHCQLAYSQEKAERFVDSIRSQARLRDAASHVLDISIFEQVWRPCYATIAVGEDGEPIPAKDER